MTKVDVAGAMLTHLSEIAACAPHGDAGLTWCAVRAYLNDFLLMQEYEAECEMAEWNCAHSLRIMATGHGAYCTKCGETLA